MNTDIAVAVGWSALLWILFMVVLRLSAIANRLELIYRRLNTFEAAVRDRRQA